MSVATAMRTRGSVRISVSERAGPAGRPIAGLSKCRAIASGSGRSSASTSSAASAKPLTLMRKALATGDRPSSAPARTAPGIRVGPRIEPSVEPHTITPIARPRWALGVTSAAA